MDGSHSLEQRLPKKTLTGQRSECSFRNLSAHHEILRLWPMPTLGHPHGRKHCQAPSRLKLPESKANREILVSPQAMGYLRSRRDPRAECSTERRGVVHLPRAAFDFEPEPRGHEPGSGRRPEAHWDLTSLSKSCPARNIWLWVKNRYPKWSIPLV